MAPHMDKTSAPAWGMGDQVFSSLLNHRIVYLGQQVDDEIANRVTAQLLMLAAQSEEDIYLYINSPGGSVTAGMAVYDTMQIVKNDVVTIAMGFCASMGQFLLTAGAPGKRFALPHTKILMHQPSAGFSGSATDIRIHVQHLLKTKTEMAELIAQHSGNDVERITADSDRDYWFSAQEAKEYGLIDDVITATPNMPGGGGLAAR
ncbi:ATP-dependent Clp protease proteolytic subunit [Streptomyces sp. LP05-1]|uniref:ATP-dependent Clp protease proteolytic subunit n=1 Tax=Streptomyces pyxinae TaxID=2970734 RepID=A0ABT2CPI5_9ACTN|nr:ATP-dependent Clp protease proteolytic subunit [Streptomyces sp. LP05-1]MCS0639355.1 ATP-dependent Clp protease proteolytic subunit [Streptomyces sp. LP05-1]